MKIRPDKLEFGDTIGIFTASNPITDEVNKWLQAGIKRLKEMGFKVELARNLFKKTYFTAGRPRDRVDDLNSLVKNKEVKMIITSMGGENAHQILPLIDFTIFRKNPKIIMGYSDPTVLLNSIFEKSKMITFYGYHASSFDPSWQWFGEYDIKYFKRILMNPDVPILVEASTKREIWRDGIAEGEFVGGCMTDLRKLIGTPFEPVWKEKILFLEQPWESPQQINVVLTHFKHAGVFDKINGLLLGKFYECVDKKNEEWNKPLKQIFLDELAGFDFPIMKTEDFGHFSHMFPVPIGCKGRINANKKEIEILEKCVT